MKRVEGSDIKAALDTLHQGGTLLYPTDTIWGIGCDATNVSAIEKIYSIKERDRSKSMIILLENENQLASYVKEIPDVAYQLIEYSERPLTIIYTGVKNLPAELIGPDDTIAIRIVNHPFCSALLQRFRRPIVSTSANLSGMPSPKNFSEIDEQLIEKVDYVASYGQDNLENATPSVIMRLEPSGRFEFIRK